MRHVPAVGRSPIPRTCGACQAATRRLWAHTLRLLRSRVESARRLSSRATRSHRIFRDGPSMRPQSSARASHCARALPIGASGSTYAELSLSSYATALGSPPCETLFSYCTTSSFYRRSTSTAALRRCIRVQKYHAFYGAVARIRVSWLTRRSNDVLQVHSASAKPVDNKSWAL